MSYSFSTLDEGHIILMTIQSDFDLLNDMVPASRDMLALLDQGPDRIAVIADAREVKINDLNTMIQAAQNIRSPEVTASMKHPKLVKYYSVINSRIAQVAMRGLNSATFGYFQATLFETVEEAIEQARAVLVVKES